MRHSITGKKIALIVGALCLMLGLIQAAPAHQEQQKENSAAVSQTKLSLTAFTYQGQLKDASGPVNGSYDFQFTLYSTQAGGEPASAREMKDVLLLNGLFNFRLDFGRAAFEAKESWLEIGVRQSGSGEAYTVLFPRQKLTPTPYAIFAQHEQWSLIGVPVGFADRTVIPEGANAVIEAGDTTKLNDDKSPNSEATAAAAPQGTANFIAKFDGSGNPTLNSLLFDNGTNVGIGTTTPAHRLSIAGGPVWTANGWKGAVELENASAIAWQANAAGQRFGLGHTGGGLFVFRTASNPGTAASAALYDFMINDAGNIGIGTITPASKVEIAAQDGLAITGFQPFLTLRDTNTGGLRSIMAGGNGDFGFYPNSFIGGNPAVLIKNGTGNVGIGTPTPQARLDVAGMTRTGILQITGGSDLSENFEVSSAPDAASDVQPGMVVSIDPENPGKLIISSNAYDRRVAGIVSGAGGVKPGMVMGHEGTVADGAHPVALTGRVYCLVDASYGAIEPGDLLTTSDTPGHAMKVRNHKKANGAIIGKAMTGLKSGQGLVLVLVTLQ